MIIRHPRPAESQVVHQVHEAAFGRPLEPVLWDRLVDIGADVPALTFVAELEGEVVGHIGVSEAAIEGRPVVAIGPLGVLPEHQRRGVGSALVHAVIGAAEATGRRILVLLGSPDYYRRFGFRPAIELGIRPPVESWASDFQALPLSAYDPTLTGDFRYAAPFHDLDPSSSQTLP